MDGIEKPMRFYGKPIESSLADKIQALKERANTLTAEKAELLSALKPFTVLEERNNRPIGRAYVGGVRQGMPSPESIIKAKAVYDKYKPVEEGDENG